MTLLEKTIRSIVPANASAARTAQQLLDGKTKPRRSLGRLEELACRLAAMSGSAELTLPAKAVVVMAADHGVAEEGVSAYPSEVTAQMVANFARGGAAINVLARQVGAEVFVVDMGTRSTTEPLPGVRAPRLACGTANMTRGPAMSRELTVAALEVGIRLAGELTRDRIGLIGVGDMGIGNTTAASALTAAFTGVPPADLTGRGTGIDDATFQCKVAMIERALAVNRPNLTDPLDVLAKLGGLEIAGLAGLMLGAAAARLPVVLDGFITGAAALAAFRVCPMVRDYQIASHRSVEPGHRLILQELDLPPLFDLGMRLGEGTGAVLAMPLIEASIRILREMATFTSAGVADTGA
jgi:nicotinate-nucleotide--dimethylbenzimidazole phosphoribosyltransferase